MELTGLAISLLLIFVGMGGLLLFRAQGMRRTSGLPPGKVIYTDDGAWHPNRETLRAVELRLTGRPDYLVQKRDGEIIPVEVKSGLAPRSPWESHILQLAAYCKLVERTYGRRPSHGILQYRDRAFAIDYTFELEEELFDLLGEMQGAVTSLELARNHDDPRRCTACAVSEACSQRLA